MDKKYIIFGSGHNGLEIYSHLKKDEVAFFCDNDIEKIGKKIDGIEIISFDRFLEIYQDYIIILSVGNKYNVRRQFERNGIKEYVEYQDDYFKNDTTLNNDSERVMKTNSPMNQLLDSYLERCKKIDILNDFPQFKELVVNCKKELNGEYAFYESIYNESMLYGYAKAIMDYAQIKIDYANFPIVTHAPFYAGTHPDHQSAAIFSGGFDKEVHNNRYPYIPIFTVGSYIQYAMPIYNKKVLLETKKQNGKTAVFFMTHSTEQTFVTYNEKRVLKEIINVYTKKYATVLVCAYWCDIDKDIYQELSNSGIKVVSAGFRFDTNFVRRLRTIIELGDDIFVYGFTSAIVYALSLKKNLFVFDCDEGYESNNTPKYVPVVRFEDTPEYRYITTVLFNRSIEKNVILPDEEKKKFDFYFGFTQFKTPEEIRMIYEVCCDIWDNCGHLKRDYPIGVYKTYVQYQKEYDFKKLYILEQSLGKGFWNI